MQHANPASGNREGSYMTILSANGLMFGLIQASSSCLHPVQPPLHVTTISTGQPAAAQARPIGPYCWLACLLTAIADTVAATKHC